MKLNFRRFVAILLVAMMTLTALPTAGIAEVMQDVSRESGSIRTLMVEPDDETYYTYEFYDEDGTTLIASQIVKSGDTLLEPAAPAKANKKFVQWIPQVTFGPVGELTGENKTITATAEYTEVYYVFFVDHNGRVVKTKEAADGQPVTTADVLFPVEADHAITGWYTDAEFTTPVTTVTIDKANVTLYAKVEAGHWLTFDSNGGSYVAPVFVPNGKTAAKPVDPTRPGYAFDRWEFDFNTVLTADATATAKWTANARTQYTVIHWQENADDDEYSYVASETKYDATGATTAATAKSYTGFTAQTIAQQTIAGDGSTIVNVYYTRNVYAVTFWTVRYGQKGTEYVDKRITAKYGANIRDKWPGGTWKVSAGGSVFQANIDVMPIDGFEFFETDQGNGKADYYLADLNGNYVLDHTDTGASRNSTVTKEDRYDITGFVCNTQLSAKNGARYNGAKFYYDRAVNQVIYINNGTTVNEASYKYQQDISKAGDYKLSDKDAPQGKEGYIFDGWAADADGTKLYDFNGKTMPAQNITVYARWKAPTYTVTFIDHNGEQYGDEQTVNKGATVAEPEYTVSLSKDEQFLGWVLADGTPFNFEAQINQDYVLYAKVASKAAYSVTYNANGGSGDVPVDSQKYAEGALADVKPADGLTPPQGKEIFLGWSTNPEATTAEVYPYGKLTIGTADVNLYAIWGVRENTVAITYKGNGGALTDGQTEYTISSLPNNGKIEVAQNTFVKPGYNFVSWNTQADGKGTSFVPGAEARVNGEGENVLYAIWEAAQQDYTVEFYYENTDGTYTIDNSLTATRQAKTEETVSVTDADKAQTKGTQYVFDPDNGNNNLSSVIPATGTLVLKLYFKLNTAQYTIHHYLLGTTIQVADDQTGTMTIGEELTAEPAPEATRMEGTNVYEYAPHKTITISADPTENVITVYYAKNVTITGATDTLPYNGSEQELTGFTVEGLLDGDTRTGDLGYSAKGTDVGVYDGEFSGTINLVNAAGNQVSYYNVILRPGKLTITPNTDEVTVTITGNTATRVYNATEQSVTGYTTDVGSKTITVALKEGSKAEAKGTNVGKYNMGLTADDFTVTSTNYTNIKVIVNDGWLEITPITDEVVVTINGNTATRVYNATEQNVTGYTTDVGEKTIDVTLNETGKDTAKGTNVGKYNMGLTVDDFTVTSENYTNIRVIVVDGWLEITPITDEVIVTITGNTDTKVYDGTEHVVTGYTTDVGEKTIDVALKDGKVAEAKGTNVGKYYMGLTAEDFTVTSTNYTNIKVVVEDGWLEITPITDEVVVTITGNTDTKVYNGSEQNVTGYTTDVGNKTIDVALKDGSKAEAKGTNVGKYNMGLTADDFTVTSENYSNIKVIVNDGWLEITPITDEVVVTITGNTDTKVYNGSEQNVTGYTTDVGNKTIDVALKDSSKAEAKGTNVGKYYMGLTAEDFTVTSQNYTNIKVIVNDGWLEITPATDEVVVTITGNTATRVYNATEQSVTGYTTDVGSKTIDVTLNETGKDTAKGTNVGKYNMGLTVDDFTVTSENYTNIRVIVVDGWLEITPITDEVIVTITGNTDTKVYDGTEHVVTGYTTDVGEKTIDVALKDGSKAEAKGINVDTYYMGLTADDFTVTSTNYANIKVVVVDGYLEITPITDEVTVIITGNTATKVYNGSEQNVTGYTTDVGNKTINVALKDGKVAEAKGTDVGKYYMGLTAADFAVTSQNYSNIKVIVNDGWLEITPITTEITITAASDSKKYDGTPLTNAGYTYTQNVLLEGDELTAVVEGSATNVGDEGKNVVKSYKVMRGSVDVTGNYTFTDSVDGKLTINPREVTLASETATKEYDGTPLTRPNVTVGGDGFVAGEVSNIVATGSVTYVDEGTVDNTITYTTSESFKADNYTISETVGKLSITKRSEVIVITTPSRSRAYNGDRLVDYQTDHTGTIVEGDRLVVIFPADAGLTDAGSKANVYASYYVERISDHTIVTDNYTFGEPVIGTLTVTPVEIELTAASDSKMYDGTPLINGNYTITKGEFVSYTKRVNGVDIKVVEGLESVTVEGSQTTVGRSANTITGHVLKENTKAQNYEITYKPGELTVTQNDKVIVVTANSHTWEYDGQPHTDGGYTVKYDGKDYTVAAGESVELPTGDKLTAKVEGTVTNVADSADDNNVVTAVTIVNGNGDPVNDQYKTITRIPGGLKITRRGAGEQKVLLTAVDNTVVYDGQPHGAKLNAAGEIEIDTSYTITYLAEGHSVQTVAISGSQTNAGRYPEELVPSGAIIVDENGNDVTENYLVTYVNGNLEITPVAEEVVVTITERGGEAMYDGTEHEVVGYDVTSISNPLYTEADFAFKGKAEVKGIDAGSYPMLLKSADFVNTSGNFAKVTFVIVDATLEIEKREVTLTSASDEKVYDGKALTNDEVTISGDGFAEGEGVYCGVTGRQLNVGESDNEFTYELLRGTKAGNYKITKKYGTLKVTPVTEEIVVTITGHKDSAKYDGTEKTVTGYDVSISNDLYQETDFTFSGDATASGLHAGKYPMGLKAEDFKNTSENFANVKFVVEDGEMEIQKIALTITSESYEGDYDAQWHEVGYTAEGLAATDTITALEMKNHRILKPGEMVSEFVTDTLKITHADGSDATGDYEVTFVPGKLTVNTVIVNYRVFYYYDGVLDESEIEEGTGEVLTQITEYEDKPKDMQFDHVTGFPLTLGLDETKNIIRVYYVHTPLTGNLGAANIGDCIE